LAESPWNNGQEREAESQEALHTSPHTCTTGFGRYGLKFTKLQFIMKIGDRTDFTGSMVVILQRGVSFQRQLSIRNVLRKVFPAILIRFTKGFDE
jgi:hypothetical protein